MNIHSATPHPLIPAGIQALVLDFDGTLADSTDIHRDALSEALKPHGIALDTVWYQQHVGLSIHDLLARLPGSADLQHDEIIAASRSHLLATMASLRAIPATLALLHAARVAGLPCAVASGTSGRLVHPALESLHLGGMFNAVVVREDAPHGKPAPDLYLEAARRLGVTPQHCLAVDDARSGVTAAQAAGMRVLTLRDGWLIPIHGGAR